MADPAKLPTEDLERARDLGAATYVSTYVRLMMRALGIDESDTESVNAMALRMVDPLSTATEVIWRALMDDHKGKDETLRRFRTQLEAM